MFIKDEIITSRNNPIVKWAASLQDKKGRDKEREFLIEGRKLTLEAIDAGLHITYVFVAESKSDNLLSELAEKLSSDAYKDTQIVLLSDSAFEKISSEKSPQGVITIIKYLDFFKEIDIIYKEMLFLNPDERIIMLSSVRDPGNLGSIIRSSVAFGTEHIILSSDCADIYNSRVVRSAMGSLFKIKITYVNDLADAVTAAKDAGRRVFSAELNKNACSISEIGIQKSDIVVIGNEGHGVDPLVSERCMSGVYIPISGKTESLNAAVAAAIFMWEQSR